MSIADINGYRMHYAVTGNEDAPVLVFIHGGLGGGDGSRDTIDRQAAAFSTHYRCVFYDRRCCGESDTPLGGYDIPNCAQDLRGLLDQLGVAKAHVLGSSAGGPIAMQFALDYPEMTETLLLVNTMSYSQETQREIRSQELRQLKERIATEGRSAAVAAALSERFPRLAADEPERFARLAAEDVERIDGIVASHQAYIDIGDSLESRLAELKMPVVIVHGDEDSRIPVECGRSLSDGIPHATLHVIPGAEHGLMTNEAADQTRQAILEFLHSVDIGSEAQQQPAKG